jgi:hypothetical protein
VAGILPPPPIGISDITSDEWINFFTIQQKTINSLTVGTTTLGTLSSQNYNNVTITGGSISGVSINCTSLQCDSLGIDQSPISEAIAASTHKLPISLNGITYYIMLSDA